MWYEKKINEYKEIMWSEFINNIFQDLGDIDFNNLSDIQKSIIFLLEKIETIGTSFSRIVTLDYFSKNIIWITNDNDNYYSLLYKLHQEDSKKFDNIETLFKINFWWTFKFFKINIWEYISNFWLGKSISLADIELGILDMIKNNLKDINDRIINSQEATVFPYTYNTHDYFLVHYNAKKKTTELKKYLPSQKVIDSDNSFYFFFKELWWSLFLVIRNSAHKKWSWVIAALEDFTGPIFSYEESYLFDFSDIKDHGLTSIAGTVSLNRLKVSTNKIGSTLEISGEKPLADLKELLDEDFDIKEIDLQYIWEPTGEWNKKDKTIKISSTITSASINITDKEKLYVNRLLTILWKLNIYTNTSIENAFSLESFVLSVLFSDSSVSLSKNLIKWRWEIENYINKIKYCGIKYSEFTDTQIEKEQLKIRENKIILDTSKEDKIDGNVKIFLNKDLLYKTTIKELSYDAIVLDEEKKNLINRFTSPGITDTDILFSETIDNLTKYLSTNQISNRKYIAFLKDSFTINQEIMFAEKHYCRLLWSSHFSKFFTNPEVFIKEYASTISIKQLDIPDSQLSETTSEEILELAGSGNQLFESYVPKILPYFFPVTISLWRKYTGTPIPDWVIISKNPKCTFLYDCKSSKDIAKYVNNISEVRKFSNYLDFFSTDVSNKNIFLIFWPTVDESTIGKTKERTDMISTKQARFIYIPSDVLCFLNYIIAYKDFLQLNWLISISKIVNYLLEIWTNTWFYYLKLGEFKIKLTKYWFDTTWEYNDATKIVSENMESKTNWRLDLMWISNNFKKYIEGYPVS